VHRVADGNPPTPHCAASPPMSPFRISDFESNESGRRFAGRKPGDLSRPRPSLRPEHPRHKTTRIPRRRQQRDTLGRWGSPGDRRNPRKGPMQRQRARHALGSALPRGTRACPQAPSLQSGPLPCTDARPDFSPGRPRRFGLFPRSGRTHLRPLGPPGLRGGQGLLRPDSQGHRSELPGPPGRAPHDPVSRGRVLTPLEVSWPRTPAPLAGLGLRPSRLPPGARLGPIPGNDPSHSSDDSPRKVRRTPTAV